MKVKTFFPFFNTSKSSQAQAPVRRAWDSALAPDRGMNGGYGHVTHFPLSVSRNNREYFCLRKLALVGIIPNQILFSFISDKDRRTDSRIRRKNSAAPPGIARP